MADSGSLSGFLSLQTETVGLADADDEDEDEEEEDEENNVHESSLIEDEGYLRMLLDKETDRSRVRSHSSDWIKSARSEAIQWIIDRRSFLRLRFRTAYLSVTYFDRFLSTGLIDRDKHWAIRLLSVACLSLAAKMEDRTPPALTDFPTNEYNFESSSIQKMELLVLTALDWRMHSITPFDFIHCFISCFATESSKRHFIMEHRSSTIAMAATLMAMDRNLTTESLEIKLKTSRLYPLFDHEDVHTCYSRMLELKPVEVSVLRTDLATSSENPRVGVKRKRLVFESEKPPSHK
ncbi:hypothetical protein OSB04_003183 [Centaurea solstitialis]|uniref:Cyclin-like domain-containing protein n=1 Tax=Centaurea solstitialis TaxID=347529 RepID=A0AA38WNH9_9ASTR|nr:hypothetical protein OSB04_003183 [Centaurea solstitialis]